MYLLIMYVYLAINNVGYHDEALMPVKQKFNERLESVIQEIPNKDPSYIEPLNWYPSVVGWSCSSIPLTFRSSTLRFIRCL